MAGYFGADFNPNQPSDNDLVKKGAGIFRDIKSRLRTFLGVLFNLETGQLKDNIVGSDKLKDLLPSPAGTGNTVVVNSKGQVTQLSTVDYAVASIPRRYVYRFAAGTDPNGETIAGSLSSDDDGRVVRMFSFTVPEGASRMMVQVQGAGGGGGSINSTGAGGGGAGGGVEAILPVEESDVYLIWVGQGGTGQVQGGAAAQNGAITKFEFDPSNKIECPGGTAGNASSGGAGGTTDVFGWTAYAQSKLGTDGTTSNGGTAGGYFNFGDGGGGAPTNGGSAPGLDGGNGRVVITFWATPE
jgi:hypothetical protein